MKESWEETFRRFQQAFPQLKRTEETFRQVCSLYAKISERRTDVCEICALYHRLVAKRESKGLEAGEEEEMGVCVAHRNVRDAQRLACEEQKENLKDDESFWVLDYGNSKSIKKKPVEDSFDFFNKLGISVIAHVLFLRLAGAIYKKICCFYSMSTMHTSQSTIDYFDRVLDYSMFKTIKKIYLWSDNAGHFKNNDFVFHLKDVSVQRNIDIQYNQFCEYEGKDECDQFFGSLSNGLERHTRLKPVVDINDLQEFSREYFKRNGTNEYVFEIYQPLISTREEESVVIDHLDDFLSFNISQGKITVAVLTVEPHFPAVLKKKQKGKRKGPLIYPRNKKKEEESDKDKAKRIKKEKFYNRDSVGTMIKLQCQRRVGGMPELEAKTI
jgi:hypothetical protein